MSMVRTVSALACCALAAASAFAGKAKPVAWRIVASKPTVEALDTPAGKQHGRIYGDLKQCPGCTIDVLRPNGDRVGIATVFPGALVYEIRSLAPGPYQLRIAAEGADEPLVADVRVQGGSETRIDIRFVDPNAPEPPKATDAAKPAKRPAAKPDPKGPRPNVRKAAQGKGKKKCLGQSPQESFLLALCLLCPPKKSLKA